MNWFSRKKQKQVNTQKENQEIKAVSQELQEIKSSIRDFNYHNYIPSIMTDAFSGEKFPGGFGLTKDFEYTDYWTLRKRSVQLFKENSYARGAIRRLLRNQIYTGLNLESNPVPEVLGISEDFLLDWAEKVEINFNLWAKDKVQCDWHQEKTLSELAHDAQQTAMVSGDCLVILRINKKTGLPAIQLIDGSNVQSSFTQKLKKGNYVSNGIEYNQQGRRVAFWINIKDRTGNNLDIKQKRIAAFGEKSGRPIAWMIYGSDKLLHENRGEPILSAILYNIKELDRNRDSEQRAATINANIPLFVKKNKPGPGSNPIGTGAIRKDTATVTDSNGQTRRFNISNNLPGMVPDELTEGEEIISFNSQRPNQGYSKFEETIINAFAWCLEIPPEILRLLFQSNFSASRQANNELNIMLQYFFNKFGLNFYQSIYEDHLFASLLRGDIQAEGLIEAKINNDFLIVKAWTNAEWSGLSRPSVDISKDAKAAETTIGLRVADYDHWSRRITGMSFRNTIQKIARQTKLMERVGITSSVDENNNGEPINKINEEQSENKQENAEILPMKFVALLQDIDDKLDAIVES